MFTESFPILLVDDEPDLLSISQLIMKNFRVFGRPLKVYTANSKAQAVELLNTTLASTIGSRLGVYVIFADVVMESDTAGLELCEYIRSDLNNKYTQIVVYTGQPGIAPERSVIDRYDINAYLSKAEANEDKLY